MQVSSGKGQEGKLKLRPTGTLDDVLVPEVLGYPGI